MLRPIFHTLAEFEVHANRNQTKTPASSSNLAGLLETRKVTPTCGEMILPEACSTIHSCLAPCGYGRCMWLCQDLRNAFPLVDTSHFVVNDAAGA